MLISPIVQERFKTLISVIIVFKLKTYQADELYMERNKLDLAVPKRPFHKIVYGLEDIQQSYEYKLE